MFAEAVPALTSPSDISAEAEELRVNDIYDNPEELYANDIYANLLAREKRSLPKPRWVKLNLFETGFVLWILTFRYRQDYRWVQLYKYPNMQFENCTNISDTPFTEADKMFIFCYKYLLKTADIHHAICNNYCSQ